MDFRMHSNVHTFPSSSALQSWSLLRACLLLLIAHLRSALGLQLCGLQLLKHTIQGPTYFLLSSVLIVSFFLIWAHVSIFKGKIAISHDTSLNNIFSILHFPEQFQVHRKRTTDPSPNTSIASFNIKHQHQIDSQTKKTTLEKSLLPRFQKLHLGLL